MAADCGVVVDEPNNEDAGFVSPLFAPKPVKDVLCAADCCVWPNEKVDAGLLAGVAAGEANPKPGPLD